MEEGNICGPRELSLDRDEDPDKMEGSVQSSTVHNDDEDGL